MKVVLLAGGFGTRISEESYLRPKPMIEIGGKPILWHIMKSYAAYGFNEFIICCGYKSFVIKDYFVNYYLYGSDITLDFKKGNKMKIHSTDTEPWKVTLIDTGLETMTGGRIKRIREYTEKEPFMLTYGDGVSDINLKDLLDFHKKKKKIATMTVVQPESRFGTADIADDIVEAFREKSLVDAGWINGGFMVLQPEIFDYIKGDKTIFEKEPLETLAGESELAAYKHHGFWQCMDTQRDKAKLETLWEGGSAPWKKW